MTGSKRFFMLSLARFRRRRFGEYPPICPSVNEHALMSIQQVFTPAKVVLTGIGVLLLAAKDVAASQDILIDIFGRIERFFVRFDSYTGVPLTPTMTEKMMEFSIKILDILAMATKGMEQSQASGFDHRGGVGILFLFLSLSSSSSSSITTTISFAALFVFFSLGPMLGAGCQLSSNTIYST
ncbi:hypothetical protein H4582DRAFT_332760 [Lactarius indigo]|nr:hypothetical protein H4582DRAFT_332760 [Lactarius indigo]